MSQHRELQTGDFVEFTSFSDPAPWGVYEVVGFKTKKKVWVRNRHDQKAKRLAVHRRRLGLVAPVEEVVAELLMETGT